MKKIVVALFVSALLAMLLPSLLSSVNSVGKLDTLYAVAGIMFSVGMSLIITTSFPSVRNEKYKKGIKSELDAIRNLYIFEFLIITVIYMLVDPKKPPLQWIIKGWTVHFSFQIFLGLSLIFSIIFFILNFISLQNLNRKIQEWLEG